MALRVPSAGVLEPRPGTLHQHAMLALAPPMAHVMYGYHSFYPARDPLTSLLLALVPCTHTDIGHGLSASHPPECQSRALVIEQHARLVPRHWRILAHVLVPGSLEHFCPSFSSIIDGNGNHLPIINIGADSVATTSSPFCLYNVLLSPLFRTPSVFI